jgi:predicted urease superfamily metal-dependent hydrolase
MPMEGKIPARALESKLYEEECQDAIGDVGRQISNIKYYVITDKDKFFVRFLKLMEEKGRGAAIRTELELEQRKREVIELCKEKKGKSPRPLYL